ncbi:MAG: SOS response-associated peptidase [Pyrinomonadaceae bacterium]|jgi:putative SOS response-associated peptidase YedK|nr:SOS response-associated peptidase [Acidobacteriota bacterium]
MCGRFSSSSKPEQIKKEFKVAVEDPAIFKPRYNIAPSQMIPVVLDRTGERIVAQLKWGLVPSWAKDALIGSRMINARAETLMEKPSFREAYKSRRCIIPASGFYEWQRAEKGAKQPFYFYLTNKEVFGFAGLWEEWLDKKSGESLETCTIITTEANDVLKPVHDRMPVILKAADYDEWLDTKEANTDKLQKLLAPYPPDEMSSHAVSRAVNSPTFDSPELIVNSK